MVTKPVQLAICTHLTPPGASVAEIAEACGATGVDFAVTEKNVDNLGQAIADCCGSDLKQIRYHAYFANIEVGDPDAGQAAQSLAFMQRVVDRVAAQDGRYLTIHLGFNPGRHGGVDFKNAVDGLKALVEYAGDQGVTICVENLRTGLTANPDDFIRLAEESGAAVTFDIGHFRSSKAGSNGYAVEDIIGRLGDRIVSAHVYEAEVDGQGHVPPSDLTTIKPALDALSKTACSWWVAELGNPDDICRTISLLKEYQA
jgi:sugar phosphate isomerase/epimerase